jgi:ATP-binding cassette subfamily B protein
MNKFNLLNKKTITVQIGVFLLLIISKPLGLLNPFIYKKIIDDALIPKDANFFTIILVAYALFNFCKLLIEYLSENAVMKLSNKNYLYLNEVFFKKFLRIKEDILKTKSPGEFQNIFNNDINRILNYVTDYYPNLVANSLVSLIALGIIFKLNTGVGLILVVSASIMISVSYILHKENISLGSKIRENLKKKMDFFLGIYNYSEYIKANKLFMFFKNKYLVLNKTYMSFIYQNGKNSVASSKINLLLGFIVQIFVLLILGKQVLLGKISLGYLIAIQSLLPFFYDPLINAFTSLTMIGSIKESFDRLQEFANFEEEVYEKGLLLDSIRTISFDKISYRNNKSDKILYNDFSGTIEMGKINFIAGHNGSGKTTLLKAILKFCNLEQGDIQVNDTDIKDVHLDSYRKQFFYVPQQPFIIDGTIYENIVLDKNISKDDLQKILTQNNLQDRIEKLGGLDKQLSAGGKELSGGEKQFIELLRVMLSENKIVLLDEPHANMDQQVKNILTQTIDDMNKKGITFVIVSHNELNLNNCHKIKIA